MLIADNILVIAYFCSLLFIGFIAKNKVQNFKDFASSKNSNSIIIIITICATWISGSGLITTVEEVYLHGLVFFMIIFGEIVSQFITAQIIVPNLIKYHDCITIGEVIGKLYNKDLRKMAGFTSLFVTIGFVGAQIMALAYIFEFFYNINYFYATMISSIIMIGYTSFGGFKAVLATDILQLVIIIIALPLIYIFSGLIEHVEILADNFESHNSFQLTFNNYAALTLYFLIPNLNPAYSQRLLMIKNKQQITKIFIFTSSFILFVNILMALISLNVFSYDSDLNSRTAIFTLINQHLPVVAKGFAVSAMIAIVMSTADSYLNAGTACFTRDYLKLQLKLSETEELKIAKLVTIFISCGAISAAIYYKELFDLLIFAESFWGPIMTPMIICGIVGIKLKVKNIYRGIILSLIICFIWQIAKINKITGVNYLFPTILTNFIYLLACHFYNLSKIDVRDDLIIKVKQ